MLNREQLGGASAQEGVLRLDPRWVQLVAPSGATFYVQRVHPYRVSDTFIAAPVATTCGGFLCDEVRPPAPAGDLTCELCQSGSCAARLGRSASRATCPDAYPPCCFAESWKRGSRVVSGNNVVAQGHVPPDIVHVATENIVQGAGRFVPACHPQSSLHACMSVGRAHHRVAAWNEIRNANCYASGTAEQHVL
jgi:hypothetical protein